MSIPAFPFCGKTGRGNPHHAGSQRGPQSHPLLLRHCRWSLGRAASSRGDHGSRRPAGYRARPVGGGDPRSGSSRCRAIAEPENLEGGHVDLPRLPRRGRSDLQGGAQVVQRTFSSAGRRRCQGPDDRWRTAARAGPRGSDRGADRRTTGRGGLESRKTRSARARAAGAGEPLLTVTGGRVTWGSSGPASRRPRCPGRGSRTAP